MLLVLDRDDHLDLFETIEATENHLETIDIENNEYEICNDVGQRFVGQILTAVTKFNRGRFRLIPLGSPDLRLPIQMVTRARFFGISVGELKNLADVRRRFEMQG